MEPQHTCRCSMEVLHLMTELRNAHAVVELGRVLELIHRVCSQGQVVVQCKDCRRSPQSSIVTFPALAEQCLSLFEAVCLAYSINRPGTLFDQPRPPPICVRSTMQLGQMELDGEETILLVRMLLSRCLMRLLGLLEALRDITRPPPADNGHSHRPGATSIGSCGTAIESAIHRLVLFMEQLRIETIN